MSRIRWLADCCGTSSERRAIESPGGWSLGDALLLFGWELAIELLSEGRDPIDLTDALAAQRAQLRLGDGVGPTRARRRAGSKTADLTEAERELFDALKAWRRQQAKVADVPAFVIFNDATLTEVARLRPSSRAELLRVSGIGAVKAERFGEQLLAIVAQA